MLLQNLQTRQNTEKIIRFCKPFFDPKIAVGCDINSTEPQAIKIAKILNKVTDWQFFVIKIVNKSVKIGAIEVNATASPIGNLVKDLQYNIMAVAPNIPRKIY